MNNWKTFLDAVGNDDVATVQQLRFCFSDARVGSVLLHAYHSNSVSVLEELLNNPSDDMLADAPQVLDNAAQCGQVEILKLVLPHIDPKAHDSNALRWAVINNHRQCIDLLFEVSDIDAVWKMANERRTYISADGFDYLEQRMIDLAQHATLTQELERCGATRGLRKI